MRFRPAPATVARFGAPLIRGLCRSWRVEVLGQEHWLASRRHGGPVVYLMWHEALLPLLWHHRGLGIAVVVSEARDGQYLADFAVRLGYRPVRGSSRRGGVRALAGAIRVLQEGGSVAFTPDGPRGPRREVKPGGLKAAQAAGAQVVPVHAAARWARRLGSWDRFLVPLPGARVRVAFGPAFMVGPGRDGLAAGCARAARALDTLARDLEWHGDAATDTA